MKTCKVTPILYDHESDCTHFKVLENGLIEETLEIDFVKLLDRLFKEGYRITEVGDFNVMKFVQEII